VRHSYRNRLVRGDWSGFALGERQSVDNRSLARCKRGSRSRDAIKTRLAVPPVHMIKLTETREIQTVKEGSEVIGFDQDMGAAMTGAKLRRWNIDPVRTINPVLQSRRMRHLHGQMRQRFETRAPQAIILGIPRLIEGQLLQPCASWARSHKAAPAPKRQSQSRRWWVHAPPEETTGVAAYSRTAFSG
jgi:hypothetical protein